MAQHDIAHPPIVSPDDWRAARIMHLAHEKELTKHHDRVAAERRRLPMARIEKDYLFDGPTGQQRLADLFDGRRQLVVYHFMFAPEWEEGCPSCTGFVDALGDLSLLYARDTSFALISRAPLAKLERYKARRGWSLPWVSSYGSDFNYDFHVTLDESIAPVEYNYRRPAEQAQAQADTPVPAAAQSIEGHGMSVFFRLDDTVFHTYSSYARGTEGITDAYSLLDITPYGRQQDFEDSPPGWPQYPTYG